MIFSSQEFSDMYSRVKRKRVQVKRNMYGVPINDSDSDEGTALLCRLLCVDNLVSVRQILYCCTLRSEQGL